MTRLPDFELGQRCDLTRGGVATLGVFDGVHIGHQAIIQRTLERSHELGKPSTLITFSVHPRSIVNGKAPKQLISLEHRLRLVEALGVDAILVMAFTEELRLVEAEDFVQKVFVDTLGVRALVIGHDTAFGRSRRGDAGLLRALAEHHGFTLDVVEPVFIGGTPVSSTRIRDAILSGDLDLAQAMLGRPVSLLGTVVLGDGRGRALGFPTANLQLHHAAYPKAGVYAVRVFVADRPPARPGVCNIGKRPTFREGEEDTIEVHLLDWREDLYDRELRVEFVARLRDERRFPNVAELVAQIGRDAARAREILAASGEPLPTQPAGRAPRPLGSTTARLPESTPQKGD
ncbi:MAG: bifunctional riboflavin kinase/FAD synthetase [Planctomycetota bacterium]